MGLQLLLRIKLFVLGRFFEGTPIPGPIPSEIGLLSKLLNLTLIMDNVYDIPSEIGNMNQFEQLNLWLDGFVGTFPSEFRFSEGLIWV